MAKTLFRNSAFALVALAISSLVGVGDALAGDPELEVGGTETQAKLPVIPPGAAACIAELATLANPSKEEANLAEEVKKDERNLESARSLLTSATAEYTKLGCDLDKGVWPEACGNAAKTLAEARKRENVWVEFLVKDRSSLTDMTSKRGKQFEQKRAKLNEMCPGGKLGTGTASEEAKPALQAEPAKPADQVEQDTPEETEQGTTDETEQDTTDETEQDTTEQPSDDDNAALAFPDPTEETTGGDNGGASETTDGDNSAAVEPDDTQEPADADDGATSEATGDDNSGAAEPDPDADFIATCNANPNCQLE